MEKRSASKLSSRAIIAGIISALWLCPVAGFCGHTEPGESSIAGLTKPYGRRGQSAALPGLFAHWSSIGVAQKHFRILQYGRLTRNELDPKQPPELALADFLSIHQIPSQKMQVWGIVEYKRDKTAPGQVACESENEALCPPRIIYVMMPTRFRLLENPEEFLLPSAVPGRYLLEGSPGAGVELVATRGETPGVQFRLSGLAHVLKMIDTGARCPGLDPLSDARFTFSLERIDHRLLEFEKRKSKEAFRALEKQSRETLRGTILVPCGAAPSVANENSEDEQGETQKAGYLRVSLELKLGETRQARDITLTIADTTTSSPSSQPALVFSRIAD